MDAWVIWSIAAALLAAGEVVTLSFLLGPVALAAAAAAAVAALGAGPVIQLAVFILGSLASLVLVRPIARRHRRLPPQVRTGPSALIGRRAEVLERVDVRGGQIKLAGEVWTARSFDEDDVFEPGARVEVLKIDGATALVSE